MRAATVEFGVSTAHMTAIFDRIDAYPGSSSKTMAVTVPVSQSLRRMP